MRGHLRGSILKPLFIADRIVGWSKMLWSMGKPSEIAPLLRPRGCIREVAKTFALPVWQKQRILSREAMSSRRKGQGVILAAMFFISRS